LRYEEPVAPPSISHCSEHLNRAEGFPVLAPQQTRPGSRLRLSALARQHDRRINGAKLRRVLQKPLHPRTLVVEFRPRLLVSVRRVKRREQNAADGSFQIAAQMSVGSPGNAVRVGTVSAASAPVPGPAREWPFRSITSVPPIRHLARLAY